MQGRVVEETNFSAAVEDEAPARKETRAEIRRRKLLTIASDLFARKGYDATSIRDVAAAAKLTSASLYYHFPSKEEMFIAVEEASVDKIHARVATALAVPISDPWERLEAAAVAHCEALLDRSGFRVLVTMLYPPGLSEEVRKRLAARRDRFEDMMAEIIDALPFSDDVDRFVFRKHYLGGMNAVGVWYSPDGKLKPADIARQIVRALKR
jgi:AcrR family transcriptional regulator